jgi:hypothetical protein
METGIQSSFIPHDAGDVKVSSPRIGGNGFSDLILLLSIVLLVASGAIAGGVFLYEKYLQTATNSKIDQLQRAKSAFEPSLIMELTRLDDRMHAAAAILSGHIAPSVIFDALEKATLTTIAFDSFDLNIADQQRITIKMNGVAESVNSIALQAQLFSKNGVISSPIFTGIGRDVDGVHFAVSAQINPAAITYAQSLSGEELPPQQQSIQSSQQAQPAQVPAAQKQPASPFGGRAQVNTSSE